MRGSRSLQRYAALAFLAAAGLGLGGCEQMADLIPDSKKPLPGERKLLFPEGVPGVTQGVPPELMRGNQQAQGEAAAGQSGASANAQAQQAPVDQEAEEKPKPKPRPRVQRTVRQQPPAEPAPAQEQQQTSPWPAPQQQPAQPSPWPSAQQQPAQPSPWPSAPPAGTFSR
jgi:hypothetical protein